METKALRLGELPVAIAANGRDLELICSTVCGLEAAWAGEEIDIVAADSLLALNHPEALLRPAVSGHASNADAALERFQQKWTPLLRF